MVVIKESDIHGKGVFAEVDIKKGTILTCDVLEIIEHQSISKYLFPYRGHTVCLHIGFGTYLNSSSSPNLKHTHIDKEKNISYFEVLSDIEALTELTLNYGIK